MKKLLVIVILLMPIALLAQQDPQFSHYMFNPYLWNPSFAAQKDQHQISLHHRTQWLGYSTTSSPSISPPSTQVLTISSPFQKIKSGIGLGFINDNIGPLRNTSFWASYAYFVQVGEGRVAGGLGVGLQSISINPELWRAEYHSDPPLVLQGITSQLRPNLRAGISYSLKNFNVGLSVNNVANPVYTFNGSSNSVLERHYYLFSSYKFALGEVVFMQPSVLVKNVTGRSSVEISNLFFIYNFWSGVSFRTSDACILLVGLSFLQDNSLNVGYNFDLTVINRQAKATSSHEIFLSYNFSSILYNKKPIVRSPRFRF